jgi:hypothetical protein
MAKYASRDKLSLIDAVVIDDASVAALANKLDVTEIISHYLSVNPPTGGLPIDQIKADTAIADAINKRHATGSDNQDISGKVDKVTGQSLVSDTAITDLTDGGETTLHTHPASVAVTPTSWGKYY